jgi:hypothetical protein
MYLQNHMVTADHVSQMYIAFQGSQVIVYDVHFSSLQGPQGCWGTTQRLSRGP